MTWLRTILALLPCASASCCFTLLAADRSDSSGWKVGTPIVTYWCAPRLTDAVAKQMGNGGWNLVWCHSTEEMDIAHRYGLRALFVHPLLQSPKTWENPDRSRGLDDLIVGVRRHPALYGYRIKDEPNAAEFTGLGRMVAYLRRHDPEHLAYINLFPCSAPNESLGTVGDTTAAYKAYVQQYIDAVQPAMLSYDEYQFTAKGDSNMYFLNLALIREAAQRAKLPFLNIVQASSWTAGMRVPTGDEMRFLVYTTLAYGAQGISYFVYYHEPNSGGMATADGSPTPLYHAVKPLNREFVAIAKEYQPLESLGVYHVGMLPLGAVPLPDEASFRLAPPVPHAAFDKNKRINTPADGVLLGFFGPAGVDRNPAKATHVLVVNLNYRTEKTITLVGARSLDVFDVSAGAWSSDGGNRVRLQLSPGGGQFVRLVKSRFSK